MKHATSAHKRFSFTLKFHARPGQMFVCLCYRGGKRFYINSYSLQHIQVVRQAIWLKPYTKGVNWYGKTCCNNSKIYNTKNWRASTSRIGCSAAVACNSRQDILEIQVLNKNVCECCHSSENRKVRGNIKIYDHCVGKSKVKLLFKYPLRNHPITMREGDRRHKRRGAGILSFW